MKKVRRPSEELVTACETHLQELREALDRYPDDPERFIKRMAGTLRQLVCRTTRNEPLLLNLMTRYDFPVDVPPPTKPYPRPWMMVGGRQDPCTQEMQDRAQAATGDPEALRRLAEQARAVPFHELVARGLAVTVRDHDYSFCNLTLAVAHQLGGAHEDEVVEELVSTLRSAILGEVLGLDSAILRLANSTLWVGQNFVAHMTQHHGYRSRYFRFAPSPALLEGEAESAAQAGSESGNEAKTAGSGH